MPTRKLGEILEQAHAKVNLGLRILGRREDGYHNILTIMQTVDLHDVLHMEQAEEILVTCTDPKVPGGPKNLAHRAADLFKSETGYEGGVRMLIQKRIPTGAGLGGGSSDAAAVLRGLCRLWDIPMSGEKRMAMATALGSDVPFLLRPGTAVASGRGEILRYVTAPDSIWYVVVYPGVEISTRWAYAHRKSLTWSCEYSNFIDSVENSGHLPKTFYRHLQNDFLPIVERHYPEIRRVRETLVHRGALAASLSGSGSTVYGVFDEKDRAIQAAALLKGGPRRVFLCQPWKG